MPLLPYDSGVDPAVHGAYFRPAKNAEVSGWHPRQLERALERFLFPSSDRKQIYMARGSKEGLLVSCMLSKEQASKLRAAKCLSTTSFAWKAARFPNQDKAALTSTPEPLTTLWFVNPPAWESFTWVLPCRCGGPNGQKRRCCMSTKAQRVCYEGPSQCSPKFASL